MTTKTNNLLMRIDPDLHQQATTAAEREHLSLTAWITQSMREKLETDTAIVLGWIQVQRRGESETNECAGCAQQLDWSGGVYAPLMSNGIVGSLHCAGCATTE